MAYKKAWKGKGDEPSKSASVKHSEYVEGYNAKVVKLMEENKAPWLNPIEPGRAGDMAAHNLETGKCYSGENALNLTMEMALRGYTDARVGTFKQINDMGGRVKKGENGLQLVRWQDPYQKKGKEKEGTQDEVQNPPSGKQDKEEEKSLGNRKFPIPFGVFFAEQCEGLPPAPERKQITEHERHEKCEELIKDSGVQINYDGGSRAFYRPSTDSVHLPVKERFKSYDRELATTLHEIGHATGHPSRLGRDLTGAFGSESYAREELTAEIASMMIGQRLGIGHDPSQHAAYLQSWIKIVKDDPKAILEACRNAEKICDHLGVEKYEHQATQKVELTAEQQAEQQATRAQAKGSEQEAPPMAIPAPDARRPAAEATLGRSSEREAPMSVPDPYARKQPTTEKKRDWAAEQDMGMGM